MEPMSKVYVRYLMLTDPAEAKRVADLLDVGLEDEVAELIAAELKKPEPISPAEVSRLRALVELCDPKWINDYCCTWDLDAKTVQVFLNLLPGVLMERRGDAIEVVAQHDGSLVKPDQLERIFPGATHELINCLNRRYPNPVIPITEQIKNMGWGNGANPGFSREIWSEYLVERIVSDAETLTVNPNYLWRQLVDVPKDEVDIIFRRGIIALVEKGEATGAARIAKIRDDREMAVWAGTTAYQRCIERHQFQEAAQIAKWAGLPDSDKAAEKALERMKRPEAQMCWANQFGLKVSEETARSYCLGAEEPVDIDLLICTGHPELALLAIGDKLASYRYPKPELLAYLRQPNRHFSIDAAEHMLRRVVDAWLKDGFETVAISVGQLLEALPGLGLEGDRYPIGIHFFAAWMPSGKKKTITDFCRRYLPALDQRDLQEVAKIMFTVAVGQADWEGMCHLAHTWDLPEDLARVQAVQRQCH